MTQRARQPRESTSAKREQLRQERAGETGEARESRYTYGDGGHIAVANGRESHYRPPHAIRYACELCFRNVFLGEEDER